MHSSTSHRSRIPTQLHSLPQTAQTDVGSGAGIFSAKRGLLALQKVEHHPRQHGIFVQVDKVRQLVSLRQVSRVLLSHGLCLCTCSRELENKSSVTYDWRFLHGGPRRGVMKTKIICTDWRDLTKTALYSTML